MLLLLTLFIAVSFAMEIELNNMYKECSTYLKNSDFADGTYRIRIPGKYCLCEDIIFNPKPGNIHNPNGYGAWFPTDHYEYPGAITHEKYAFALGFFAAITIETSNVEIDLQNHEIRMHPHFYIQQRFYNHIQVQRAVFLEGQGPAKFGPTIETIQNIEIKNGKLGLSSHNGIHGFDTINVYIHDIVIENFEITGLQFNGFNGLFIKNVHIGPSVDDQPLRGYYASGKFALNGFELISDKKNKFINFRGGRKLNLIEIEDRLRTTLDIMFRYVIDETTDDDRHDPEYDHILEMYNNTNGLPDGSTIYGMLLNSNGRAVHNFGQSPNDNDRHGSSLKLENIYIDGLSINVNEVPTLMFDRCDNWYYNEDGTRSITPIVDKFGATFDVRFAQKYENWYKLDNGFNDEYSYKDIVYNGNSLSDAQIALDIYMNPLFGSNDARDRGTTSFRNWVQDIEYTSSSLPDCARFICNADCMSHTNKGIVGLRLDGIENVEMKDIFISNLHNKSPLSSNACSTYRGPEDGGHEFMLSREGAMKSDIRGISIINGGEIDINGNIFINNLVSDFGDVIGIHIMDDAKLFINDDDTKININNLKCGNSVSIQMYNDLNKKGLIPYPNNIYQCNIKTENLFDRKYRSYPYDMNDELNKDISSPLTFGEGYFYPFPPNGVHSDDFLCRKLYEKQQDF